MTFNKEKVMVVVTPIIALLAGYFGYEPIQEVRHGSSPTTVEVVIPEQKQSSHSHSHSHDEFKELAENVRKMSTDLKKLEGWH